MSWALNGRRVPVEQIRPAILKTGIPARELGRRIGISEAGVRVVLGQKTWTTTTAGTLYGPYSARTITYDRAVQLVRAAGLDPVDVGL